jgi:hypothetical protein
MHVVRPAYSHGHNCMSKMVDITAYRHRVTFAVLPVTRCI